MTGIRAESNRPSQDKPSFFPDILTSVCEDHEITFLRGPVTKKQFSMYSGNIIIEALTCVVRFSSQKLALTPQVSRSRAFSWMMMKRLPRWDLD